jgi:hypothetical protein
MAALLQAPPANEKCSSRCPAKATDTVQIVNVDGVFYFCHHHARLIDGEKIESIYSTPTQETKINVRNH